MLRRFSLNKLNTRYVAALALFAVAVFGVARNDAKGASTVTGLAWKWTRSASNPVLVPDLLPVPAISFYPALGDPSVLFDDGRYKMWFGYGGLENRSDANSLRVPTAYAESTDGVSWQVVAAPALSPGSGWDRTNAETPSVIRDDGVPSGHARKYRMYYAGLDTDVERLPLDKLLQVGMGYGIGLAFSPDGRQFTRLPAAESPHGVSGLVLKPHADLTGGGADFIHVSDPYVLFRSGLYHMWYTSYVIEAGGRNPFLGIAYATSNDGIRWSKQGLVIQPDRDWERERRGEPSVGRPSVVWDDVAIMAYDAMVDTPVAEAAAIGFATSTDGRTWTKDPANPTFVTNLGRGEAKGLSVGAALLKRGGSYQLFFGGFDPDENRRVFNLATAPTP